MLPNTRAFSVTLLCLALVVACDGTTAEQHLDSARSRMTEGEVRTAVIELKNALQKSPDLAEARLLLGEAHARLGDYPAALKEFERALDLGLDNDRVRLGLLRSKLRLGRINEVIGELEGVGELSPQQAVILGDAYLAAEDLAGARAMYQRGADLAEGSLGLATIAWQEGDAEQAAELFRQAVERDPENADAWLRKGEFELSRSDLDAAATAYRTASALPAGSVLGHVGLARVELMRRDLDAASASVARVLKLAPEFPVGHYLDGLVRFEQQDMEAAESAIREVQRVMPDHGPSLYLMGAIKYRQGRLAQAEDNLQRFLAQQPDNESAAKLLASLAFDSGAPERAVGVLEPFRQSSMDPQLLAMYGAAQLRLGNATAATQALERAVELAPDMAPFRNQLALSLLAAGDQVRAEAELESAIDVDAGQFQSDYLLAMLHLREEDWDAAAQAIKALIQKNPDSPVGYNMRGALAQALGDPKAAETGFREALAQDSGFLPAVRNLARLAEQAGDLAAAAEYYETFLEDHPGQEGALVELADLALRRDDVPGAIGYLERATTADSTSVRARLGLARLQFAQGRLDAASRLVDEALVQAPELADLLLLRAELDLRQGNAEAARALASRMQSQVAEAPDNAQLRMAVGLLQARVGQLSRARGNLERALALMDEPNVVAFRTLARIELGAGDLKAARERTDALLALDSSHESRLLDGELLLAEGHTDQGVARLEDLADAGVRNAVVHLATMDLRRGAPADAVSRLEAWLTRQPDDLGAELLLADALMQTDQDRALTRYEKLADSDNPVVLNNLAWLYMERDDPRAVEMARRAAAAAPDNPDVLDTLGWVLVQKGEGADEAVKVLRRSVDLNPGNPTVQYHLGVALRDAGDVQGARAALTRATTQSGGFPELEQARAALAALPDS